MAAYKAVNLNSTEPADSCLPLLTWAAGRAAVDLCWLA